MVGKKRKLQKAAVGGAKERHKRAAKVRLASNAALPLGLEARLPRPKTSGKHHSYFEFVENADKKKKLDYQVTNDQNPPPGFTFIPIGNPQLTTACKELSREKGAMIFIVSATGITDPTQISHHIHRTGHHIRESIVDEAKSTLSHLPPTATTVSNGQPEPLPESQDEYTKQVNGVIRDLFPRIPHTDRQAIIVHTFNLSNRHHDPKPVGLCEDLPLSRRVQLAVLAHIRHTHTRYDQLLRETKWEHARKIVEQLCLDIIVRWRGDEETGRDQLDEILREVVVISDSDDEEDSDESEQEPTESSSDDSQEKAQPQPQVVTAGELVDRRAPLDHPTQEIPQWNGNVMKGENDVQILHEHMTARSEQRGFKRYRAWELALQRNRGELEAYRPDANRQSSARPGPDARLSMAPEEARPANLSAGSVPTSNGFVPPPAHRPQPALTAPGSYPGPSSVALPNAPVIAVNNSRASWTPIIRHVSPSTHRLEDMLVRSIEPASPEDPNHPSFMRPQQSLSDFPSPTRHDMPYRPAEAGPEPRTWNVPPPAERPLITERTYQEISSPGGRRVGYGEDRSPRHGYASHYNDPAMPRLRSPVAFSQPQVTGPPTASHRTVVVNAPRPGEHSNPIVMEDRGGFFQRVQAPANGAGHHNVTTFERPAQWMSQPLHRASGAPGGSSWDERPRVVGPRRDDPDVDMIAAPVGGGSGFHVPRVTYPSPMPPPAPRPVGYGEVPSVNPGYGAAVTTPMYGASFDHRPGAEMHIAHRPYESIPHYQQPVYRHYQNEQATGDRQHPDQRLGPQHRRESVIIID